MHNSIRKLALIVCLVFGPGLLAQEKVLNPQTQQDSTLKKSEIVSLFEKKQYEAIILKWGGQALQLKREEQFLLAQSYFYQKNNKQAIRIYELMLQTNPKDAPAWRKIASLYKEEAKFSEAISALKKAIEINPNYEPAYLELAQSILGYKTKSWYEVRMIYEDLVAKFGLKIEYQREICDLAVKEGQHVAAEEACTKAIKLKADDTKVLLAQGQLLRDLQKTEQANSFYTNLSVKFDKDFNVQLVCGDYFKAQGKKILAIECYQKANHLQPDYPGLDLHLARLGCEMQNWDLCDEKYRSVCKTNKKIRSEVRVRIKELKDLGATDFINKFEETLKSCMP